MSTDDIYEMAIKLRACHATMKRFYGDQEFEVRVGQFRPLLEKMAVHHDGNIQAAAIKWCNDTDMPENMRPLVLAIAVEIKLKETAELCAAGRS